MQYKGAMQNSPNYFLILKKKKKSNVCTFVQCVYIFNQIMVVSPNAHEQLSLAFTVLLNKLMLTRMQACAKCLNITRSWVVPLMKWRSSSTKRNCKKNIKNQELKENVYMAQG